MALLKKKNDKNEKVEYVICERCELNYIPKKQKYCDVCKAELSRDGASMLLPEEDDEIEKLCPICKVNYMNPDEEICFMCLKEKADRDEMEEKDWDELEKEAEAEDVIIEEEPLDIPLDELAEEEEALEEEDEEFHSEPDDFEYVDPDDEEFDDLDDDDDDDDDDI